MSLGQNKEIENFLQTVCAQVKWQEVHRQIKIELLGHIEEAVEEHLQAGCNERQAVANALAQMGEPVSLGQELHSTHKPRTNWGLVALAGALLTIGLLTLSSIEMQELVLHSSSGSLVHRTLIYAALGLAVVVGLYQLDYRRLQSFGWSLYGGTLLVWLLVLINGSPIINGYPYLGIGSLNVNFITLTPFLLAVALAGIFTQWHWDRRGWLRAIVLFALPNILYLATPSLISIIIYSAVFLALISLSGANIWRQVLPLALALGGAFLLFLLSAPYRLARFTAFLNPHHDPIGSGYIYNQLARVTKVAGLWGQGFTFPTHTLPEVHTDFALAYLIYTFGWMGGLLIVALAASLICLMVKVAREVKEPFGKLLVGGLTVIFATHLGWSVLMTVGLAPTMWVSLPFISYGGSQIIVNMATMGLVLSVYRRKNLVTL